MAGNISLQIPKKKRRKWDQKQLCSKIKEAFSSYGLNISMPKDCDSDANEYDICDLDPNCSVLIHKLNPLLGDVWAGVPCAIDKYKHSIKQYEVSGVIVIDPLSNVLQVINRYQLYMVLSKSRLFHSHVDGSRIRLPNTVSLGKGSSNTYENGTAATDVSMGVSRKQMLARNNISYPCMFKPLIANGEEKSHQLALILNDIGLATFTDEEGVIQQFINHLPVLYKLFVINDQCFLVHRSSIKNMDVGTYSKLGARYDFDSRLVSSPNASCELIEALPQENIRKQYEPSDKILSAIKNVIIQELGITLFGVDIIKDLTSDDYYIIDVNYFPGYEGIPDFPDHLAQHVLHYSRHTPIYAKPSVCCSHLLYPAHSS